MRFTIFCIMLISHSLIPQDHNSRKLFLFATSIDDIQLKEQLKILKSDPGGLSERDLMFKVITPDLDRVLYNEVMKNKMNFLLLLYGKDGGIKIKTNKPISIQQLYSIIDSMPMRKEEVRQKHHK